ncbi:MAG: hypothetical protein K0S32_2180 [Bacteroidetes bacterium]|jgi:hypothetical protein|nr:hypothetical protein [Bacteroidota bacterium]
MKSINVGFDTIGNATMICYDREPILVTDPWIKGSAYFGSWGLSHEIPEEQMDAISKCRFVWYSHGHPDHLNWDSIETFKNKEILLPDHYGNRIYNGLKQEGYKVKTLKDKVWYPLSPKIKVMCFSDIFQDAVLLIDINGRLAVNTNDANRLLIWNKAVRKIIKSYDKSLLLSLTGHGDAEMINFRDSKGELVMPPHLLQKNSLSSLIATNLDYYGVKAFIPFSSLHRYQRSDSIWAEEVSVKMEEYTEAHLKDAARSFPPFVRYNCENDSFEEINPKKNENIIYPPEHFGDNWTDPLSAEDFIKVKKYFTQVEGLKEYWDFITVVIGGKENTIELKPGHYKVGVKFEAPRNSFMFSVENNIFEDMLIGNYMKTTWIGKDPLSRMYPDTLPLVKYADNGLAYTKEEVEKYLEEYAKRYPFDSMMENFQKKCASIIRKVVSEDSKTYSFLRNLKR